MASKFEAIVIGTGQAGPSLAARLADAGMTMAIIAGATLAALLAHLIAVLWRFGAGPSH